MAANAREIRSAGGGPFSDLFVDRWNLHAIYAGPASRVVGIHHACTCLGARDFRRFLKDDARALAPSETFDDSLSRHGLAGAYCGSSNDLGDSVPCTGLAYSRPHRL